MKIPKMVNKVITYLDYCKIYGPDGIPEVVLKSCEPDFSCILVDIFTVALK